MAQVEQELAKVQDMKPQLDQLAKSQEILKDEKEQLELANQQHEEKSRVLEEKLTVVEQTKDQVNFIYNSAALFYRFGFTEPKFENISSQLQRITARTSLSIKQFSNACIN